MALDSLDALEWHTQPPEALHYSVAAVRVRVPETRTSADPRECESDTAMPTVVLP